jgi:hypothetical protein
MTDEMHLGDSLAASNAQQDRVLRLQRSCVYVNDTSLQWLIV